MHESYSERYQTGEVMLLTYEHESAIKDMFFLRLPRYLKYICDSLFHWPLGFKPSKEIFYLYDPFSLDMNQQRGCVVVSRSSEML